MPTITTLTLNAAVTGTHGWTCGHAFRKGDLPAGQTLLGLQLNIKNYWPDGSAKFGILSGQTAITAGTPAAVTLQTGHAAAGLPLTIDDLKATGITAAIDCGAFGSSSWSGTDWDTPLEAWFTGPLASSWRYRKAVGSDPHLSTWLEIRLWAGGAVEVLQWVENSTINTAGIVNKSATYSFTLGGSSRFSAAIDLPNRCRTPLLSGAALSYYLGTDPGISFRHNAAYFSSTKLVSAYGVSVPDGSSAITGLPTTFTPLQQGNYPTGMGSAGYHQSIGVLPGFDVPYLTNATSPIPWAALQRNAYSAGRYGIHWRDEATNEPALFATYPTHGVGNNAGVGDRGSSTTGSYFVAGSGTGPQTWKASHCPAVGYLAYLVTGRKYHAETVQFAATTNHFRTPNNWRQNELGVLRTDENSTRSAAWSTRTLAHAASVTPDSQTALKTQFIASLAANASWYHGQYVAQANNPQGFTKELEVNSAPNNDAYTPAAGAYTQASWMHDFYNAAVGLWKALELPLGGGNDAKLDAFYLWKAKSTVGRFGGAGATEHLGRDAAPRALAVAPADSANWNNGTGPWFANWGQIYDSTYVDDVSEPGLTYGTAYTSPMIYLNGTKPSKVVGDGSLRGLEGIGDATGLWGDLMPALAYAVTNGVPGAQAAWDMMTSAPNFSSFTAAAASNPVWAVVPHAVSAPALPPQGATTRVDGSPLLPGFTIVGVAGHGVLGAVVPTTGDDGASLLDPYLTRPYDNDVEVRIVVTAVSSGVTIQLAEDGSGVVTVPSDGAHWVDYEIHKAGVLFQTDRANFSVGALTGAMAATESGSDTASAAGYRSAFGSMAATESGYDTAFVVGGTINSGVLNASEAGSDTATFFAAGATNSGQMNASESGSDTARIVAGSPFSKVVITRRVVVDSAVVRVTISAE